jgi:hypothetical protein
VRWWRTCKLTLVMASIGWAADGDPQAVRLLDVGDNIIAVWSGASLVTVMGIVFHAGQLANRVKSLESRMTAADEAARKIARHAEDLAGLIATVDAMQKNIEAINDGIHEIRNQLMALSRR